VEVLVAWLLCGAISAFLASRKERAALGWLLVGMLFGPFGLLLAILVPSKKRPGAQKRVKPGTYRECPYCAELIKAEAIKCGHCSEPVDPVKTESKTPVPVLPTPTPQSSKKKRENLAIILALIVFSIAATVITYGIYDFKSLELPFDVQRLQAENSVPSGESLISGTVSDWRRANYGARFEACKTMVRITGRADAFWRGLAENRLGEAAKQLEICISTAAQEAPATMKVSEMGATCIVLMQYDM